MLKAEDFEHPHIIFTEDGKKRLVECIEFINSKRLDLAKNFRQQFFYTEDYWNKFPNERLKVSRDFAPLSFYFVKEVYVIPKAAWCRFYNGGIIFHGDHDGGGNGGAPTFSVNICPVDGWATHT